MGMRKLVVALAAVTLAGFGSAKADPPGPYLGVAGGYSLVPDLNSRGSALNFQTHDDDGFIALGHLGYDFGGPRLEAEFSYRRDGIRTLSIVNGGALGAKLNGTSSPAHGDVSSEAAMVNALYGFHFGSFTPYLGAGVGYANIALDGIGNQNTAIANGTDEQFAYQAIAGGEYALTYHVALGFTYRYLATLDPHFRDVTGANFSTRYQTHSVLVDLVFHFGAPPPPPRSQSFLPPPVSFEPSREPPPQALSSDPVAPVRPLPPAVLVRAAPPSALPEDARRAIEVYFDFNKSTLTGRAQRTIEGAVEQWRRDGGQRITVTGYTDLAGASDYNIKLSQRRAYSVRDYLVSLGVPA